MRLRLLKNNPTTEEVFLERYKSLFVWAKNLTGNDIDLAEDLVQEAFIQFTLTAPDLNDIQNLDGYLYGLLRNLCLSHHRRETRNRLEQLSVYEYDSAEDGLRVIDFRDSEDARDDLQKICAFLTVRKNTARSAGIFILRFFQGYFPSEISQILQTSRAAVDVRLMAARKEIKAFLENPKDVKFIGAEDSLKQIFRLLPVDAAVKPDEFLSQLRNVIFRFREGEHFSIEELKEFYEGENPPPLETGRFSHLVSCPQCLEEVNLMLKLPGLASRFPTDSAGRDKKKDKDFDDNDSNGTTGGDNGLIKLRRRVQSVFEHKPTELRVLVNGTLQGALRANAEFNELKLNLSNSEPISFIEIFSEQQKRLLILNVEDQPPVGECVRTALLSLSDERKLDLGLNFTAQGAELRLIYLNPDFHLISTSAENFAQIRRRLQNTKPSRQTGKYSVSVIFERWKQTFKRISFSPRRAAAVLGILIFAAVFFVRFPNQAVSASALLKRSETAEFATDKIIKRKITVKAASVNSPSEFVVRDYEEWINPQEKFKLRRAFDKQGNVQTIIKISDNKISRYAPKSVPLTAMTTGIPSELAQTLNAWEYGLTASEFRLLIGDTEKAKVEEQGNYYLIRYTKSGGEMLADLTLERNTLRPVSQHLEYRYDGSIYTYDFTETNFEEFTSDAVNPQVFEIDSNFRETKSKTAE